MVEQCLFDELILFVLETISSKVYLEEIGINRYKVSNWDAFKKSVRKDKIPPGLYARTIGRGQVHYYGVDNDGNIGNGYVSKAGLNPKNAIAVGLDAQPDHSHGLCQTFALMFINSETDRLYQGDGNMDLYFQNVIIGLCYLREFIHEDYYKRERCWEYKDMIENMTKLCKDTAGRQRFLSSISGDEVCLTNMIDVLLHQAYRKNLKRWFYNY